MADWNSAALKGRSSKPEEVLASGKKLTIKVDFICVSDAAESEDRYALKDKIEESIRTIIVSDLDDAV